MRVAILCSQGAKGCRGSPAEWKQGGFCVTLEIKGHRAVSEFLTHTMRESITEPPPSILLHMSGPNSTVC